MSELSAWDSFYVIVGSAAGALIGLQFVVMTLIAERPPKDLERAGAAFATPTIVHFSVVLLISALLQAPWKTMTVISVLWAIIGFIGIIYVIIVSRRVQIQKAYQPVLEDWIFYVLLPLATYVILTISAFFAFSHAHEALFGVGAAVLLLLFIGIQNAWGNVAYHVLVNINKIKE